jgi:hypothetical protein
MRERRRESPTTARREYRDEGEEEEGEEDRNAHM